MAGIDGTITMSSSEYRPCFVGKKKALFHRWIERVEVVPPVNTIGGHGGGVMKTSLGIVEYEDGKIAEILPGYIRFANDGKFCECCFGEVKKNETSETSHVAEEKNDEVSLYMVKALFVTKELSKLLKAVGCGVLGALYDKEKFEEYVTIVFDNGFTKRVCVTGDNLLAISRDVLKAVD